MASPSHGTTTSPSHKGTDPASRDLTKLRTLLLAPEQRQLENIQKKIDSLSIDEKSVGRILPNAIILRSQQDSQLAKSLSPIIEDSFSHSIQKSPQKIADAISPIMSPAIRKAILAALRGMVQSLNQTLEHSVSLKGLKWRVEAFRTGKPFAEIVLLHTLRFRVEQVFLIHRETGILLQHAAAEIESIQDEEVVSGMLTAIQDFVRDSFGGKQADVLESLRVGELTVWIEQGPQALLAGVIRGNPPQELHEVFQDALETIHVECSSTFDRFSGDVSAFDRARPDLEDCLQAQFQGNSSKPSFLLLTWLGLIGAGLVWWGGLAYMEHQRWAQFLKQIEQEPGIIVTSVSQDHGTSIVNGLRDPLSVEPAELARQAGLSPESIEFRFEPYFSTTPEFLELRALSLLQPPPSVKMTVENAHLLVSGKAPHDWVRRLENFSQTIPGLTKVVTEHLIDTDVERFDALRGKLEKTHIFFSKGSSHLSGPEAMDLNSLSQLIHQLDDSARNLNQLVRVEIRGQTSQDGSLETNRKLRLARASSVLQSLRLSGLTNTQVEAVGSKSDDSKEKTIDPDSSRRVLFRVKLIK
ncbi:MAG: OmpA family protein [Nitrospirales bacterium]|nr:OmpA family protein [Nitrospira sp.]MDR4501607.1 OmpA family protein [Nitrospirales bacterium]